MLYLLHQLSEPSVSNGRTTAAAAFERSGVHGDEPQTRVDSTESPKPSRPADRGFVVDSPAFNEAFANAGLLRLATAEGPEAARHVPVEKQERKVERPRRGGKEDESTPQTTAGAEEERSLSYEPTERVLLRDLPFTLQGLSSTNLEFTTLSSLKLPPTLPVPIISLLHTLAEPSLLYKNLSTFVESSEGGLVGQSFRSALGLELRSYLGLVATLEGQIRRALHMLDEAQPNQGIGKAGVTLKRCVIWTREATMGLRLMSLMVEESKGNVYCLPTMAK
jgi:gamma-tubulin complex component 3